MLWRTLRTWPWADTWHTMRQRFAEDRLGLTAGSLTFTTMIGLVPLMTVMLALFTAFPMFARFQQALERYLLQSLVPDSIAKPVLAALTQFAAKASQVGTVGLVVLLVAALALVFTIDRTLNTIWRVRKRRPLAQRVLVYWAALTLGPLLLGVSLSLTSYAISASRGLVDAMPGGIRLLLAALEFGLLASGLAGLYRFAPNTYVRWTHAWAGGVFAAVGFELAKRGLAWYVSLVPTYSVIYGAFATLPIFLLWIYLSWVVVLLGAVIAAYAPSLSMRVARVPDTPGYRFALAVALLRELTRVRGAGQQGPVARRAGRCGARRPAAGRAGAGESDRARLGGPARRRRRAPPRAAGRSAGHTGRPVGRFAAARADCVDPGLPGARGICVDEAGRVVLNTGRSSVHKGTPPGSSSPRAGRQP